MNGTTAAVLIFACLLVLYVEAKPSDLGTKAKDVKEPKEIKDAATATKEVKDAIKNAKEAKKVKKECMKECGLAYDPVCAHDLANLSVKPKTFGTLCALEVHNCDMGTKLTVKNKGECAGAGGVKLYV